MGFFGRRAGQDDDSILFFFLLLVIIFCNCRIFDDSDELLFFFLILVVLFNGDGIFRGLEIQKNAKILTVLKRGSCSVMHTSSFHYFCKAFVKSSQMDILV